MSSDKILVTGACGFIGSHLCEMLVGLGENVVAFDRYNRDNNWGWLEDSPFLDDMEIVLGDVRDYDSVVKALNGCKAVFHLAALVGIPYSYISPLAYLRTNIEGTYNVLESCRNLGIDQVIITSTSETYGTAQYVPMDEQHPLVGQSPYSASKIAADQLAVSYFRSFQLPIKIVRPFNTYGPRQSARAVIPTIIDQISADQVDINLGNVEPTRDLTFVKDTCNGMVKIYESSKRFGEVTNIGMNSEISIADLARTIGNLMGVKIKIVSDGERQRPLNSEVERLVCDNTKLITEIGWEADYSLEKGLSETIDWFRSAQSGTKHKKLLYRI